MDSMDADDGFFGSLSDPTGVLERNVATPKASGSYVGVTSTATVASAKTMPSVNAAEASPLDSAHLFGYATAPAAASHLSSNESGSDPFGYDMAVGQRFESAAANRMSAASTEISGAQGRAEVADASATNLKNAASVSSLFGPTKASGDDFLAYLAQPDSAALTQPLQQCKMQQIPVEPLSQVREPWVEQQDDFGRIYYYNRQTRVTTWNRPNEEIINSTQLTPNLTGSAASMVKAAKEDVRTPGSTWQTMKGVTTTWTAVQDDRGRTYYFNSATREARWDKPAELLAAEHGLAWEERVDKVGRVYYFNRETSVSQWEQPDELKSAEATEFRDPRAPAIAQRRVEALTPAARPEVSETSTGNMAYSSISSWEHTTQQHFPTEQHPLPTKSLEQRPQCTHPDATFSGVDDRKSSGISATAKFHEIGPRSDMVAIDPNQVDRRAAPHCVATFGFGGQLVTVFPRVRIWSAGAGKRSEPVATVRIWPVSCTIDRQQWARSLLDNPGPLVQMAPSNSASMQATLTNFISSQAQAAAAQTDGRLRGRELLWLFLHHLIDNHGVLQPADNFAALLRQSASSAFGAANNNPESISGSIVPASRISGAGNNILLQADCDVHALEKTQVVGKRVQQLLLAGRSTEACEHAMRNELWDVAIMLAATMDQQLWPAVTLRWAQKRFSPGTPTSLLMHVMTGHQGQALQDHAESLAVQDWRRNLEILLISQATGDEGCEAIYTLGERLHADGQLYPAHLCFLVSGVRNLDKKMPLVGAAAPTGELDPPASILRDVVALQLSDVYEYTRRLGAGGEQNSMVDFQPSKLFYATMLAELGLLTKAKSYVAQIEASIHATGNEKYDAIFRQQVSEFRRRLHRDCSGNVHSMGPKGARTRPQRSNQQFLSTSPQAFSSAVATKSYVPNDTFRTNRENTAGDISCEQSHFRGAQHSELIQSTAPSPQVGMTSGQPINILTPAAPSLPVNHSEFLSSNPNAHDKDQSIAQAAASSVATVSEQTATTPAPAKSSGWVGSLVGRFVFGRQGDSMDNMHADSMKMYFDEELKKWVDPSNPESMVPNATIAPPPLSSTTANAAPDTVETSTA
eukprot:SAG31_NODE_3493_length_4200_cov_2.376158_1_plen_1087_part_10